MKVITAYETEDGELFSSKIEAEIHEDELHLIDGFRDFWDRVGYSGMTASDAASLCIDNIDAIKAIFRDTQRDPV